MTIGQIADVTNGILNMNQIITIEGISTDTRNLPQGSLYIALKGDQFDGHDFIQQAFDMGAVAVMGEKPIHSGKPVILVRNTREALGKIAAAYRASFQMLTVAVTGSVGKTSTKEMIAHILAEQYQVCKTKGNLNNDIGLPKTLLSLHEGDTACVLELGMSALGEISYLSKMASPDIAVITGIGTSHMEQLGSRENILSAKLEILDGLHKNGKLILNADDELLFWAGQMLADKVLFCGIENKNAAILAENILQDGETICFNIVYAGASYKTALPMVGIHNVYNALMGFAVGIQAGIAPEKIVDSIQHYQNDGMRQKKSTYHGITVIADCYNASPDSMFAAIDVISHTACIGKRVAVFGDMLELGASSKALHQEIGALVGSSAIDLLICCGEQAKHIAASAEPLGKETVWFPEKKQVATYLMETLQPGDAVIFKASRSIALEDVIHDVFGQS